MKIALEKQVLNLPLPLPLGGYANRKVPATSIHDPLFINCFYLENNTSRLASFSLDLLGIYDGQYKVIVDRIKQGFDDDLEVLISCVHSHAAPDISQDDNRSLNRELLIDEIVNQAITLIKRCQDKAITTPLNYGHMLVENVGANRRSQKASSNTRLQVVSFESQDGPCMIVNFNTHPTLLSETNLLISKDFQGSCMDLLIEKGYKPLYLQGACGDISTRFTRENQTFEESKRIGELLAQSCLDLKLEQLNLDNFSFNHFSFELPKKIFKDEAYYLAQLESTKNAFDSQKDSLSAGEVRILETAFQGSYVEWQLSKNSAKIPASIPAAVLHFDKTLAIVYLPFELFSKLQDNIIEQSPFKHTLVVGYTFDGLGYLPDADSAKEGGYEVLSSAYLETAGDVLVQAVLTELNKHA